MKTFIKEHKELTFFIALLLGFLILLGFILMPLFQGSEEGTASDSKQDINEVEESEAVDTEELPEHFAELDETVIKEMNENEDSFYNSGTFENAQKKKLQQKEAESIDKKRGQLDESVGNLSVADIKKFEKNEHYSINVIYEDDAFTHTHDSVEGMSIELSNLVIYEIEVLSEDLATFYDVNVDSVFTGIAYDIERKSKGLELEFLISRTAINDNHDNQYIYDGIMSEVTPQITGAKSTDKSTVSYLRPGSTGSEISSLLLKLPRVYDSITDEAVMNETQVEYFRNH